MTYIPSLRYFIQVLIGKTLFISLKLKKVQSKWRSHYDTKITIQNRLFLAAYEYSHYEFSAVNWMSHDKYFYVSSEL